MASDSDHIPKPSKRIRCRISDSESSDDSFVVKVNRKCRSKKVLSDDSSDEDVNIEKGKSLKRKNHEEEDDDMSSSSCASDTSVFIASDSTDSEWESDWESSSDSSDNTSPKKSKNVQKQPKKTTKSTDSHPEGAESDESDGQSEKCPICLLSFRKQEIGIPSSCDHCFCLLCINEWSRNINTCPVDRLEFNTIHVKARIDGEVTNVIPVEPRSTVEEPVQENPTLCEVCHQGDREDRLLLCDGCDSGYHLECLTPPMDQVPIEEWFCPGCSRIIEQNQDLTEMIQQDFNELPDIIAEARLLGQTYGRRRLGFTAPFDPIFGFHSRQRLIPRTRQSERVRASVHADRNRTSDRANPRTFDPDQPSTSSGLDSISENSRASGTIPSRRTTTKSKSRKTSSRKKRGHKTKSDNKLHHQKVYIREYNTDGEEQEIVTYVKVKSRQTSRKRKKRTVKSRKKRKTKSMRRKLFCQLDNIKAVRKRLALTLSMARKLGGMNSTGFSLTKQLPGSQRSEISNARYRAGIPQLNLFGNNLALDYSPSGSDDEMSSVRQDNGVDTGSIVGIQHRGVSSINTIRRRLALKSVTSSTSTGDEPQPATDLITNIINSQKLWHSKEKKITLKADGTLIIPDQEKDIVRSNDASQDSRITNSPEIENTIVSTTISSVDIVQAPLYNNSRGSGNNNNADGGNFRGNYYNRNHNRNDYSIRDSYSSGGQQNYGGSGSRNDFGYGDFRPPPPSMNDFRPNFDNRRLPPGPGMPPFRGRNNFRNNNGRQRRFNSDRSGPFRSLNQSQHSNFSHINNFPLVSNTTSAAPDTASNNLNSTEVSSSPLTPVNVNSEAEQETGNLADTSPTLNESVSSEPLAAVQPEQPADGEECDIYSDMEIPVNKSADTAKTNCDNENNGENVVALLPPPVPPSDLLDFEDNMKSDNENESDENDLVIDDTPKESGDTETNEMKTDDKYDPFSVIDSDSNDSTKNKHDKGDNNEINPKNIDSSTLPLEPPPMPPDLPPIDSSNKLDELNTGLLRLDVSDDEDDNNSQSDCPNFSIYSSETMDVARHTEQELTQQIGPLEPPPMPPSIPDDDDIIVADVQACDLTDIPEPSDPYIESLQKERQTLSKIPPKKLSIDARGKITFKIGSKFKLNNKLCSIRDELDDNIEKPNVLEKEKEKESKEKKFERVKNDTVSDNQSKSDESDDKKNCEGSVVVKSDNDSSEKIEKEKDDEKKDGEYEVEEFNIKEVKSNQEENDKGKSIADVQVSDQTNVEELKNTSGDISSHNEDDKLKVTNDDNETEIDKSQSENISIDSMIHSDIELEKEPDKSSNTIDKDNDDDKNISVDNWDSDGAYTPCKDEMPIKEKDDKDENNESPYDSGLEPITPPTKDRSTDDLDVSCATPIDYAGLGTEAISENDEPINFEDELLLLSERQEKENKNDNDADDNKSSGKKQSDKLSDIEDSDGHKKKKDKRDKCKDTEKNKENISSENHVAWKKISKNNKERQYREKMKSTEFNEKEKDKEKDKDKEKFLKDKSKNRDKSKEKIKKKKDETDKKKVKRKELPRYDVRKIVAEKPVRPRKDEYGRDIRGLSRSLSRSRSLEKSNKRSHSRERLSRSYSPRMNLRCSRSWSRHYQRSWSRDRSPSYKQSTSRGRKKSLTRDRRSLSRRRSRSLTIRRSRRSSSNQRLGRRNKKKSISRKHRSRSRSWSRSRSRSRSRQRSKSRSKSRSRKKDKSKKHKSRSHSRRRKRSRSKSMMSAKVSKSLNKKRIKRKMTISNTNMFTDRSRSRDRSYSRERNYRSWNNKAMDPSPFSIRTDKDQLMNAAAPTSWSAQWTPSWSRSRSRTPIDKQRNDHIMPSHGWSPSSSLDELGVSQSLALPPSSPPSQSSLLLSSLGNAGNLGSSSAVVTSSVGAPIDGVVSPKNLTVILRNKDANKNKKKKDKRREAKERKKSRDLERRKVSGKRNRTPPPSKAVFASGDNILVSVCFNNDNVTSQSNNVTTLTDTLPLLTTTKRRRRDPIRTDEPLSKKPKKDRSKEKRSRSPKLNKRDKKKKSKAAEIAATKKPVAVIDLDQSPFREQTLSPQDVIVLSDDDNENNDGRNVNVNSNNNDERNNHNSNNNNSNSLNNSNAVNDSNNCLNGSNNVGEAGKINGNSNDNNVDNIIGKVGQKNSGYDDDDDDDGDDQQRTFGFVVQPGDMKQLAKGDDKGLQQQEHHQQLFQQQYKQLQQKRSISLELDQFMMQGPKTPPEPQVKFCINKQPSSMRQITLHPLFDIDQDDEMEIDERINTNSNRILSSKVSRGSKEKGEIDMFEDGDDSERNADLNEDQIQDILRKEQNQDGSKNEGLDNLEGEKRPNGKKDSKVQKDSLEADIDEDDDEDEEDRELELGLDGDKERVLMESEDKRTGESKEKDDDNTKRKEGELENSEKKSSKSDNKNSEAMEGGKIGPNTPPEPPISPLESPDVYDPFDPTKSRSPTPSIEETLSSEQKHNESTLMSNNEKPESEKPKVISMVTIKRAISPDKNVSSPIKTHDMRSDVTKAMDNQLFKDHANQMPVSSSNLNCFTTINPVLATVAAAVQRSGIFNLNNPPSGFNVAQRNSCQINRLSPSGQLKQQRTNDRVPPLSNVFSSGGKNLPVNSRNSKPGSNRNSSMLANNGSEVSMDTGNDMGAVDTSSPYSPGSSLSDGIFDPPSPARNHHSPPRLSSATGISNKKDAFDALFGSSPVLKGGSNKLRIKKSTEKRKRNSNSKVGVRMDENQLQILDDLPSSAVEMQVKDKFLKKLNRQERVVEEVKLVLKPHYTKKHVTKEEYKDIMRKAVPKICHNKTGEINPKKIAQLIEAYVKRCRSNKRKNTPSEIVGKSTSTSKALRPSKNIWS
ncbi:serine/arginine repetitive matrix protein 2 isoform X2 [Chelonus insularis]|uniref:serine/arginine repetitive matrix protein 2 isoform X2 n=1 Tax=Chelonus insularis TaxID=460826 RepID=UPI00158BFF2E|nr:serine/arginine repetitive matrix protein 2 isoform X2 [Chelonus insularis]